MENAKLVKKQHYISQCVLLHFSSNKQAYEALVSSGKIYKTNISNSMCERFTYEHSLFKENNFEQYFMKIESNYGPAIFNILDKIKLYEQNGKDYNSLLKSITNYMREFIIFYYRSGALLFEFSTERKQREDRILLLLNKIADNKYLIDLGNTIKYYYESCILKSDYSGFLISDQFISTAALGIKCWFSNISNRHMGLRNVIILVPISSNYYVAFFNGRVPSYIRRNTICSLTKQQTEEINEVIINNSYFKCVGNSKIALESAIRKFVYESPTSFYAGSDDAKRFIMGATVKKEIFFFTEDKRTWDLYYDSNWFQYLKLPRNAPCFCGSGEKYKECCFVNIQECKSIYSRIKHRVNQKIYVVNENATIEKSIFEFYRMMKK